MRLLDLFCGIGGASVGYWRSGFDVTGVDIVSQPFYPFTFIKANALSLDYDFLMSFDVIHASPPCQAYCAVAAPARKRGKQYPDLFVPVRRMLIATGLPYIIENVPGSPARGIGLCGSMFGLGVKRHRIFESNIPLHLPDVPCTCSAHIGEYITVAGSSFGKEEGAAAMGIDWPVDKFQLKEAIPPAYTEFLGRQLLGETENPGFSVSNSNRRFLFVSCNDENLALTVSERPVLTVSEPRVLCISENDERPALMSELRSVTVSRNDEALRLTVLDERRCVPVTRRCGACGEPLPQGTSRRKYCNARCRLHAFRAAHAEEVNAP
jgi:DNA (cytosine-5)-methyltransferase 1